MNIVPLATCSRIARVYKESQCAERLRAAAQQQQKKKTVRKTPSTHVQPAKTVKKKKRCPRGSRRNKVSGLCVSNSTGETVLEANDKTPVVKVQTPSARAYSPSINAFLTARTGDGHVDPFGCEMGQILVRGSPGYKRAAGEPRVSVGFKKDGSAICKGWKTKAAQDVMLRNMNLSVVDCSRVMAPKQKHSNCWF